MKRQTIGVLLAFGIIAAAAAVLVAARSSRRRSLVAALPTINLDRFPPSARPLIAGLSTQVQKEPSRSDRWGELGYALAGNNAFPEAAACFARAEELEPDNFRWPHLVADALIHSDRRPDAIAALKRAVKLMPNSATTVGLLAETYLEDGDEKHAEALLRPLVTDKTDDQWLLFEMARVEASAGSVDHAIALGEKAAALAPRRRRIHQLLSQLYQRKGDDAHAKKQLRLLELFPKSEQDPLWPDPIAAQSLRYARDVETLVIRARRLIGRGEVEEAIRTLEQLTPEERASPPVASALAMAKAYAGDFAEAEKILAACPTKEDPNLTYAAGVVALLQRKFADAAAHFHRAAIVQPDQARARAVDGAYTREGECLFLLKRNDEAAAAFEQALKLNPGNFDALVNLAELYLQKGRKADASRLLSDAALLEPDNPSVKELQQRLAG